MASSPEVLHHAVLAGQVEEVEEEPQPLHDLPGLHAEDPAEVHHRLLDSELAVQRDLLWPLLATGNRKLS